MRTPSPDQAMSRSRGRWQVRVGILGALLGLCVAAWQARRAYRARRRRQRTAVERWEDEGGALGGGDAGARATGFGSAKL